MPTATIELKIPEQQRPLVDGFVVGRVLPVAARRHVGPFVFFDHLGPAAIAPGRALDVPPHPHIGLSTVTYLFEGEVHHRDSLGASQTIRPGDINWMTAGRGIAHSERTPEAVKQSGGRMHGIQLWVALPKAQEQLEPSFHHHPASTLPTLTLEGATLRVLAGAAYGRTSPVAIHSPLFYVEALIPAGGSVRLPDGFAERAIYPVDGEARVGEEPLEPRTLTVVTEGDAVLRAVSACRLLMLGGAPLSEPRFIWWNFVASSAEVVEAAALAWREGRFAKVVGDEVDFVPAPAGPRFARRAD